MNFLFTPPPPQHRGTFSNEYTIVKDNGIKGTVDIEG
jgi:hypothetical protein